MVQSGGRGRSANPADVGSNPTLSIEESIQKCYRTATNRAARAVRAGRLLYHEIDDVRQVAALGWCEERARTKSLDVCGAHAYVLGRNALWAYLRTTRGTVDEIFENGRKVRRIRPAWWAGNPVAMASAASPVDDYAARERALDVRWMAERLGTKFAVRLPRLMAYEPRMDAADDGLKSFRARTRKEFEKFGIFPGS